MGVEQMWFGTEDWMQWIPAPVTGANMSPEAWGSSGTLANGGGYALGSWGSHKRYVFEWSGASARSMAQLLKDYSDGTYGRGLLHFINPLSYDTNIAPARLASPQMAVGSEGSSLVYGLEATGVTNASWQQNRLPVTAAQYDLGSIAIGYRGNEDSVFIPIPDGYQLYLGAFHQATGTGGVFYTPVNTAGGNDPAVALTKLANTATNVVPDAVPTGLKGVRIWVGRTTNVASTLTFSGFIARLFPIGSSAKTDGPWVGGDGHSGCRIEGKPTYVANTGVGGGQIGYAATLREVGSWAFG